MVDLPALMIEVGNNFFPSFTDADKQCSETPFRGAVRRHTTAMVNDTQVTGVLLQIVTEKDDGVMFELLDSV